MLRMNFGLLRLSLAYRSTSFSCKEKYDCSSSPVLGLGARNLVTRSSVHLKMQYAFCVSNSQIPIKVSRALNGGANAGSSASSGNAGGSDSARLAKRSGWKRWWWLIPKWWSTMGAKMWKATSWLSWTLWVALKLNLWNCLILRKTCTVVSLLRG